MGWATQNFGENVTNSIRAGVAGLTTALILARKGYKITVVAQHFPGDLSIDYTSPWAVNLKKILGIDIREQIGCQQHVRQCII